jgi:hypothetical protein
VARHEGQVKLDGEIWTARPFNDDDVYEPGDHVTVVHIDGATAVVQKVSRELWANYGKEPVMEGAVAGLILVGVLVVFAAIIVAKSIALIPQAEAAVIERLGRLQQDRVGSADLAAAVRRQDPGAGGPARAGGVVPAAAGDHRGQPDGQHRHGGVLPGHQPAGGRCYQISNYIVGVEQLTTTTLRNVVGGMTLEQTLTSRDQINGQLRGVLDEATGRWGCGWRE